MATVAAMYPPFSAADTAWVERMIMATFDGVPFPLDVTGHSPGRAVKVFLRGQHPETDVCFIIEGAFGDETVGWAYRIWDDPDEEPDPYERWDTLEDCAADHVEMAMMHIDEVIGTTAHDELGAADAKGVHWL
jgi:hypothetical protein